MSRLNRSGAFFGAAILAVGSLVAALVPTAAFAATTLQAVRGSGEFETLETAITVTQPEALKMQWITDQAGAAGGTWQVRNASAGNQVVASGETPAPATVKQHIRFTIAANAFLLSPAPTVPVNFNITILPHNAAKQPLGSASAAVAVSQIPDVPQPPIQLDPSAVFPSVEIVSYVEKFGVVPLTQIEFAGADVKLRVSNKGKGKTDPMWLFVKDKNLLMRQSSPNVSVQAFESGASQVFSVHLGAILPPPTSQLPTYKQYTQWYKDYRDRCGVDLIGVLDWRGPQAQEPLHDHLETALGREGCPPPGGSSSIATCQQQCFDEYAVDKPGGTGVQICLKACQDCKKKCH